MNDGDLKSTVEINTVDEEDLKSTVEVNTVHTRKHHNMLTNTFTDSLKPERYEVGRDIEKFIMECERYFRVSAIDEKQRSLFVNCFMNKELIDIYEKVKAKITNYRERLRKAFERPASLVRDLTELVG